MVITPMHIVMVTLAVFVVMLIAEFFHALRCRRVAHLAFGHSTGQLFIAYFAGITRVFAMTALALGLMLLFFIPLQADAISPDESEEKLPAEHHLMIAMDVSPSMHLKDAGEDGELTRGQRGREIVKSIIDRLDMRHTHVSVVAFYSAAKPVVVDTNDPDVVDNILNDLPLDFAFESGKTNMYEGVKACGELARSWGPRSATIVVISDGDTLPAKGMPALPPSIAKVLVVGVGSPHKGMFIDGHSSRQNSESLNRLALRLNGLYHNANDRHVPTAVLDKITESLKKKDDDVNALRFWAFLLIGAGAGLLASISPLLGLSGVIARDLNQPEPAINPSASAVSM